MVLMWVDSVVVVIVAIGQKVREELCDCLFEEKQCLHEAKEVCCKGRGTGERALQSMCITEKGLQGVIQERGLLAR